MVVKSRGEESGMLTRATDGEGGEVVSSCVMEAPHVHGCKSEEDGDGNTGGI